MGPGAPVGRSPEAAEPRGAAIPRPGRSRSAERRGRAVPCKQKGGVYVNVKAWPCK